MLSHADQMMLVVWYRLVLQKKSPCFYLCFFSYFLNFSYYENALTDEQILLVIQLCY